MSTILVGSAPDSWGVWFPDDPQQTPYTRFLDEVAASGYEWIELGPFGYLPTDPKQLSDELNARGLQALGGDGVRTSASGRDSCGRKLGFSVEADRGRRETDRRRGR